MLLSSWLSSLDFESRPKIVSTTGEFHSMFRQLQAMPSLGIHVDFVESEPMEELTQKLLDSIDDQTAAVLISRIYFESSKINTGLHQIVERCRKVGTYCLIDDYHGTNVVPLSLRKEGWEDLFLLIGGYKYLQWGEGNCFLRFPKEYDRFPLLTGWFSSFGSLSKKRREDLIEFDEGDQRFASATYDPISQFRAAKVVEYFQVNHLNPKRLRAQTLGLTTYLRDEFKKLGLDTGQVRLLEDAPADGFGGFVSLFSSQARAISAQLLEKGVFTDARGSILRLGPAPYTTTAQCNQVLNAVSEATEHVFRTLN